MTPCLYCKESILEQSARVSTPNGEAHFPCWRDRQAWIVPKEGRQVTAPHLRAPIVAYERSMVLVVVVVVGAIGFVMGLLVGWAGR